MRNEELISFYLFYLVYGNIFLYLFLVFPVFFFFSPILKIPNPKMERKEQRGDAFSSQKGAKKGIKK